MPKKLQKTSSDPAQLAKKGPVELETKDRAELERRRIQRRELQLHLATLRFQYFAVICGVLLVGMFMVYSVVLVIEEAPDEKLGKLAYIGPACLVIFFAFAFGRAFTINTELGEDIKRVKRIKIESTRNVN